jgi:hypothetical protein
MGSAILNRYIVGTIQCSLILCFQAPVTGIDTHNGQGTIGKILVLVAKDSKLDIPVPVGLNPCQCVYSINTIFLLLKYLVIYRFLLSRSTGICQHFKCSVILLVVIVVLI